MIRLIVAAVVAIAVVGGVVFYVMFRTEPPEPAVARAPATAPTVPPRSEDRPELSKAPAVPPRSESRTELSGASTIPPRTEPSEPAVARAPATAPTVPPRSEDRPELSKAPAVPPRSESRTELSGASTIPPRTEPSEPAVARAPATAPTVPSRSEGRPELSKAPAVPPRSESRTELSGASTVPRRTEPSESAAARAPATAPTVPSRGEGRPETSKAPTVPPRTEPSEPAVARAPAAAPTVPSPGEGRPELSKAPTVPPRSEGRTELPGVSQAAPPSADPAFDVVRVNPEGNAVIAGRASPKSEVTVYAGEDVVGTVKADDRGEWVLVPEAPLESGAQTLSLGALDEEGETTKSEHVVVVMIPDREVPAAGDTPRVTAGEPRQVIAVAIPRETFGASRVLQGPTVSPDALSGDTVQLSAVNYDERGRLVLAGVASPGSEVRVKIDDRGIGSTVADDTGYWELTPAKAVAIGDHTLSVASVDEAGRIITSTEMPFMRADVVEASLRPGELRFIVQPGNSLWRIARAAYGQGVLYTVIYSANAGKIEDPDLIYPGQIFTLPPQH